MDTKQKIKSAYVSRHGNEEVFTIEGNYQRKRFHRISPHDANGIRFIAYVTNGALSARVFEIRAYE